LVLATWKTMIGDGPLQEGDPHYLASGPVPTAVANERTLAALGVHEGEPVSLSTQQGSVVLTAGVGDMDDGVVWAPSATGGVHLGRDLGAASGSRVVMAPVAADLAPAAVGTTGSTRAEERT
jgi:NADH-quinone oxidoreductase subunit G